MRRYRTFATAIVLMAGMALPPAVLANSVTATTNCDFVTLHVGQVNKMYGAISYQASDWWLPKTGYYTTNWEWLPYFTPVVTAGDAPHGSFYKGSDPNFGHTVFRQDGSFTVWGDATKSLSTKAEAESAKTSVLNDTTSGTGHTWDDWDRCANGSGWVTITN